MKPHRALIVDDERLARVELRRLLEGRDDVEVVAEADDAASARALLAEGTVDLVFLDIRLGETTGFDVLTGAPSNVRVVFVTAYGEHAVRAFEVDAVDYLLKPVDPERLDATLSRMEGTKAEGPESSDGGIRARGGAARTEGEDRWAEHDWLCLPDDGGMEFVQVRSIVSVIAKGDYTRVRTEDGKTRLVLRTMREWERRLPDSTFLRVHRSAIANLHRVERVEEWSHYTYRVHLTGIRDPLPMSRRYAAIARGRLT